VVRTFDRLARLARHVEQPASRLLHRTSRTGRCASPGFTPAYERNAISAALKAGLRPTQVAKHFGVSALRGSRTRNTPQRSNEMDLQPRTSMESHDSRAGMSSIGRSGRSLNAIHLPTPVGAFWSSSDRFVRLAVRATAIRIAVSLGRWPHTHEVIVDERRRSRSVTSAGETKLNGFRAPVR